MIKLGLIGYPLSHSMSPDMHNAAMAKLGIEGNYSLYETSPDELKNRVEYFKQEGFKGFNATIPHKIQVIKYLDFIDDFAKNVGAVNTVVIDENKKLSGYNTDVYGFMQAIPISDRNDLYGKKAVILGSGGAARAAGAGIAEMRFSELEIITLPSEIPNAEKIKELINSSYSDIKIKCSALSDILKLADVNLLVNTTPVGMQGNFEGISPVSEYTIKTLPDNAFVYDIVYKPQKTKLLEIAEKNNFKILGGLDMLILQGARGFELWTEKQAPVEVMKNKLLSLI